MVAAPLPVPQMEAATNPNPGPGLCCKPGGRLDRRHGFGFVHHIQRNQFARDKYDKKVKQAAKEKARRLHMPVLMRPREPQCKCTCRDTEMALPTQATQTVKSPAKAVGEARSQSLLAFSSSA